MTNRGWVDDAAHAASEAIKGAAVAGQIAFAAMNGPPAEAAIRGADLNSDLERSAITLLTNAGEAQEEAASGRQSNEVAEPAPESESSEHRDPWWAEDADGMAEDEIGARDPDEGDQPDTEPANEADDWANAGDEWAADTERPAGPDQGDEPDTEPANEADDWANAGDEWAEPDATDLGSDADLGEGDRGLG
ncbi:hypothetical protein N866_07270 [Actinotalea ferrariae CF5-4]|uniref:Uncharacterized protein n=1 Tax=Actinotalea ferrariae CF5-4 TaxID=948458 RepID=A0A021VN01_9CELL|nr:hypothetical protein [Actinotalea ferrariae]EYR62584.1 hypothetical protein N866_07270 [Actinotalea ferrariae CF5-4]